MSTRFARAWLDARDRRQPVVVVDDAHRLPADGAELLRAHLHDIPRLRAAAAAEPSATWPSCPSRSRSPTARRPCAQPTSGSTTTRPRRSCWPTIRTSMRATSSASSTRAPAGRPRSCSPRTPCADPRRRGRAAARTRGWHSPPSPDRRSTTWPNEVFAGYSPALQQVLLATCQQAVVTVRRRDRDVRAPVGRRPARAGSRGRPAGHPDPAAPTPPAVLALPPAAGRAPAAAYRALGTALAGRRPGPRARGAAPPPAR